MNQQDQFETNQSTIQPVIQSRRSETAAGAESLADLALTAAQAEATKAGPGGLSAGKVSYSDLSVMIP